jgi:hypothetical protein
VVTNDSFGEPDLAVTKVVCSSMGYPASTRESLTKPFSLEDLDVLSGHLRVLSNKSGVDLVEVS